MKLGLWSLTTMTMCVAVLVGSVAAERRDPALSSSLKFMGRVPDRVLLPQEVVPKSFSAADLAAGKPFPKPTGKVFEFRRDATEPLPSLMVAFNLIEGVLYMYAGMMPVSADVTYFGVLYKTPGDSTWGLNPLHVQAIFPPSIVGFSPPRFGPGVSGPDEFPITEWRRALSFSVPGSHDLAVVIASTAHVEENRFLGFPVEPFYVAELGCQRPSGEVELRETLAPLATVALTPTMELESEGVLSPVVLNLVNNQILWVLSEKEYGVLFDGVNHTGWFHLTFKTTGTPQWEVSIPHHPLPIELLCKCDALPPFPVSPATVVQRMGGG